MVNSLFRRLKYRNDSDSLRKNIEKFLNYKLKYLEIYYLLIVVCEERVKVNFEGIKCRGKAFVNAEEGENSDKNFKSPKNDFFVGRNENYNFTRILNPKLKYSERY